MSKAQSEATQIRNLKRELRASMKDAAEYRLQLRIAEGKATKAQQEAADWKRRFDTLLANMPAPLTMAVGQPIDMTPKIVPLSAGG